MEKKNTKISVVLLHLNSVSRDEMNKIITYLNFQDEVIYITEAIGLATLEFELMLPNYRELHEFIKRFKLEFPKAIRESKTLLTYREHYINYFPI